MKILPTLGYVEPILLCPEVRDFNAIVEHWYDLLDVYPC